MGDATAVVAYKGFNRDFTCRGFQYRVGETYEHDGGEVKACVSGFHACEHPLDVFRYYAPATSRFAEVAMAGRLSRYGEDSKVASSRIMIVEELSIHELIERAIRYAKPPENAAFFYGGAATAEGNYGAATAKGHTGTASATGKCGVASASGDYGAATVTGNYGAAIATGLHGAASATGERGAAIATGYCGAATASGHGGAAVATGRHGRASGANGCALVLVERDANNEIIHVWAGIVGRDGIKPNTFYTLRDGRPVEVED